MMDAAIQVANLTKHYGQVLAVDNLSFEVHHGEIFGLLGPNGAGKTTCIRMILDLIKPDSGEINVLGGPMREETKARIGYLPEERGLYRDMTIWDTLLFLGQLKGLTKGEAASRAETLLKEVDLWDVCDRKIEALSRGMTQKAQFVAAALHEPDLVIIDEPFSGLDPVNTQIVRRLIYGMRDRGAAIVMSTHQMHQVEEMCQRILLLDRGASVIYGQVGEVRDRYSTNTVSVTLRGQVDAVPGVSQLERYDGGYRMTLEHDAAPEDVLRALVNMPDVQVQRFERVQTSLEEIFVQVVGHGLHESEEQPELET